MPLRHPPRPCAWPAALLPLFLAPAAPSAPRSSALDTVTLVQPLALGAAKVAIPAGLSVTAAFSDTVAWTVALAGRRSGNRDVFTGRGPALALTWDRWGSGYYALETVDVTLSAPELDPSTPPEGLRASFTVVGQGSAALAGGGARPGRGEAARPPLARGDRAYRADGRVAAKLPPGP